MKWNELDLKSKTIIQIIIATTISILFQFIIPSSFRPLTNYMGIDFEGGIFGTNNAIFTLSIWLFSFSISWFIYMDNPYINSFITIALIPFSMIVAVEFSFIFLYWDYIHLVPIIIGIYIIWKKRISLKKREMMYYILILFVWLLFDYFFGLAYSEIPLVLFLIFLILGVLIIHRAALFFIETKTDKKIGIIKKIGKCTIIFFWIFGIFIEGVFVYWYFRPNTNEINQSLGIETWVAVDDGWHNSNTELIFFKGKFYLVHDRRPFHFYVENFPSFLFIWASEDAKNWSRIAEFSYFGKDIRDPKFTIINETLFLYCLINDGILASPYQTLYTYSKDGINWNNLHPIESIDIGWNFWRPKTFDNNTWYVPAYEHLEGSIYLFNTSDGINWSFVSEIHPGPYCSEPAIEFLENGSMLSIIRHESSDALFGGNTASTIIAIANSPYTNWTYSESYITKLDGSVIFSYMNKTFGVGRLQPELYPPFKLQGSIFAKKRTAIFLIENESLHLISELPSAGDTSYVGAVINGTDLYLSYYTSNYNRDFPWIIGWLAKSQVRIAKINLTNLMSIVNTL